MTYGKDAVGGTKLAGYLLRCRRCDECLNLLTKGAGESWRRSTIRVKPAEWRRCAFRYEREYRRSPSCLHQTTFGQQGVKFVRDGFGVAIEHNRFAASRRLAQRENFGGVSGGLHVRFITAIVSFML